MRFRIIFTTLFAVLSLVGLSACSSDNRDVKSFNSADVSFLQDMIPHHRQATEMAKLAADRTKNPEVLDLATKIIAAQQPEIDLMSGWLLSWDKKVPSPSTAGQMPGMTAKDDDGSSMPGMMSDAEMSSLEESTDAAFDATFLTLMIDHHRGAIEMAATEETAGKDQQTVALAQRIQTAQTAEITAMESLLS